MTTFNMRHVRSVLQEHVRELYALGDGGADRACALQCVNAAVGVLERHVTCATTSSAETTATRLQLVTAQLTRLTTVQPDVARALLQRRCMHWCAPRRDGDADPDLDVDFDGQPACSQYGTLQCLIACLDAHAAAIAAEDAALHRRNAAMVERLMAGEPLNDLVDTSARQPRLRDEQVVSSSPASLTGDRSREDGGAAAASDATTDWRFCGHCRARRPVVVETVRPGAAANVRCTVCHDVLAHMQYCPQCRGLEIISENMVYYRADEPPRIDVACTACSFVMGVRR